MNGPFLENVKGFLLSPVVTFRQSGTDAPAAVFLYLGVLLLINAILSTLVALAIGFGSMQPPGLPAGMPTSVAVFIFVLIGGFILTLIGAAWVHIFTYLLGGRRGIMQTLAATVYASTPGHLFSWIPLIGFIAMIWSLVLLVIGIRELQALSTTRAILAVAIACLIPLIIVIIAASYFLIASSSMTVMPVPP